MTRLLVQNDNNKIEVDIQGKPEDMMAMLTVATRAVAVRLDIQSSKVLDIVKAALEQAQKVLKEKHERNETTNTSPVAN